jgi:predicted glycosyltransferase
MLLETTLTNLRSHKLNNNLMGKAGVKEEKKYILKLLKSWKQHHISGMITKEVSKFQMITERLQYAIILNNLSPFEEFKQFILREYGFKT